MNTLNCEVTSQGCLGPAEMQGLCPQQRQQHREATSVCTDCRRAQLKPGLGSGFGRVSCDFQRLSTMAGLSMIRIFHAIVASLAYMTKTEDRTTLSGVCYSEQSLSWALLLGGCALGFIPPLLPAPFPCAGNFVAWPMSTTVCNPCHQYSGHHPETKKLRLGKLRPLEDLSTGHPRPSQVLLCLGGRAS